MAFVVHFVGIFVSDLLLCKFNVFYTSLFAQAMEIVRRNRYKISIDS